MSTHCHSPTDAPTRVLMVSDVYFPRINGVSTSIETFCTALDPTEAQVRLVVPEYPGAPATEPARQAAAASAAPPWRVAARRLPFDPEDRLMRWRDLRQTLDRAAEPGIDLVHIQTPFAAHYAGLALARRLGTPVVTTYHTHFEEYIEHYLPWLPRRLAQALARTIARRQCDAADAVIAPSPAMAETLRGYGIRRPIHILPTGIPLARFSGGDRAAFRRAHGIAPDRPVALFVGRVAHEKNIDFLLRALPHALTGCPDPLLLIAGEGPALSALRHRVARAGLDRHVRFVGYLDRERSLCDCYAAADLFVFASRTETQGLVLLEAMAAGLPIFALSHLGTRTIVDPGAGAVAAPDDPAAFGRQMAALLSDRPALARLAAEARGFARNWAAPQLARELAALYRTLML